MCRKYLAIMAAAVTLLGPLPSHAQQVPAPVPAPQPAPVAAPHPRGIGIEILVPIALVVLVAGALAHRR